MRFHGKKAAAGPWMKTLLYLVLGLLFVFLAVNYLPDLNQKITEVLNIHVLSKANLEPVESLDIGKVKLAEKIGLDARITILPSLPACQGEELKLSAFDSQLPEDINMGNLDCTWDLDIRADTPCPEETQQIEGCGDKKTDNDKDIAGDCAPTTDKVTAKSLTDIKLTTIIKDAPNAGVADKASAKISTTSFCACPKFISGNIRNCAEDLQRLVGTALTNGQQMSFELPKVADVRGLHIKVKPSLEGTSIENLRITALSYYAFAENVSTSLVLDGSRFIGSDGTLVDRIRAILRSCRLQGTATDACTVYLNWYFETSNADNKLLVEDIIIPYELSA